MILVTGAAGRVGRHLVKLLARGTEKVRVLVHEGMIDTEKVEVIYGDILDKKILEKSLEGVDTVYHLAAIVNYLAPKEEMFKVNVLGTKNLVELSKGKKIIYLSSTATMPKKIKQMPVDESLTRPENYYGETKLLAEKIVLEHGGIVIRSSQIFGPGFTEGYDLIFSKLEDGSLPLIGDGKNFIHWVHIDDVVQALVLAKEYGKPGQAYLVAGKEVKTLKELLRIMSDELGVEEPKKKVSESIAKISSSFGVLKWKVGGKKPEMIPEYVEKITSNRTFDISKAKDVLGYEPKIGYKEAIKEMVEEYKKGKLEKEEDKIPEEESKEDA